MKPYRVVSATGHVPHHHIRDGQDLAVFRLLNEDGHAPGHQLAVILYALRPGNELAVRVVSCRGSHQSAGTRAQGTCLV